MDTVTHGLAGYVVAKTGLAGDTGKWGVVAGVSAALFPDLDIILGPFVGTEFTIKYHRGITNSLFLIVPLSLFFAWLFVKISGKKRFGTFFLIWAVESLLHTFLDLATSYGTMILSPLSSDRFALDWLFIIDPILTGILLFFSIAMFIRQTKSKSIARLSLTLATVYVSLCAANHLWALSLARAHAHEQGLKARTVAALPQPLSPFHWANFIVTNDTIYRGLVNLIGNQERVPPRNGNIFSQVWAQYQPVQSLTYRSWTRNENSPWVKRALTLDGVKTYLWFARFPVIRYEKRADDHHRVTLFDLRFSAVKGRKPFKYEVIFNSEGAVIFQGFHKDLPQLLQPH
jgi:inner membrane protein